MSFNKQVSTVKPAVVTEESPDLFNRQSKLEYQAHRIVDLGNGENIIQSQSYGSYQDGDSNPDYRHKP